jgi:hypothetical protein
MTTTQAPGWELRELERQQHYLDRISVLRQIEAHLGGIADYSKAPPEGDVLAQLTVQMAPPGVYEINWPVTFQAVSIGNTSGAVLTVVAGSGGPSGTPPRQGAGEFIVNPGVMRTVSIRGHALSIFGPAGTIFDFTAYSRPRPPNSGAC